MSDPKWNLDAMLSEEALFAAHGIGDAELAWAIYEEELGEGELEEGEAA